MKTAKKRERPTTNLHKNIKICSIFSFPFSCPLLFAVCRLSVERIRKILNFFLYSLSFFFSEQRKGRVLCLNSILYIFLDWIVGGRGKKSQKKIRFFFINKNKIDKRYFPELCCRWRPRKKRTSRNTQFIHSLFFTEPSMSFWIFKKRSKEFTLGKLSIFHSFFLYIFLVNDNEARKSEEKMLCEFSRKTPTEGKEGNPKKTRNSLCSSFS